MSCFTCFAFDDDAKRSIREELEASYGDNWRLHKQLDHWHKQRKSPRDPDEKNVGDGNINAQNFTFRELASATKNFRPERILGEGAFGRVYKGYIKNTGQVVAVKQLDRNGWQGNKEFLVEVLMLSLLHHENLVNLIGYCADGDQRLLVYEFMPLGSLDCHLFDIEPDQEQLDWNTRMKIAFGIAKALEYLHAKVNPPIIYRDLKPPNILLDEHLNPKLSDLGLARLSPVGDNPVSTVMGTYGYCAPDYVRTGKLTFKSDIYSFGVVLLELITGRRVIDNTRHAEEQNLVDWAQPYFRDSRRFQELADPRLNGEFQAKDLNQAVAVAAMCLQEDDRLRPFTSDVVEALSSLQKDDPEANSVDTTSPAQPRDNMIGDENNGDKQREDERRHAVAEAMEWGSSKISSSS